MVLGIQFALWTVSGIFFAWTTIGNIRGEHLRKEVIELKSGGDMISPSEVKTSIDSAGAVNLASFRLVNVLEKPYYETIYVDSAKKEHTVLFDAVTGEKRGPVDESEARKIATASLKQPVPVSMAEYLTSQNVGGH